jgi:hypothetical protein
LSILATSPDSVNEILNISGFVFMYCTYIVILKLKKFKFREVVFRL